MLLFPAALAPAMTAKGPTSKVSSLKFLKSTILRRLIILRLSMLLLSRSSLPVALQLPPGSIPSSKYESAVARNVSSMEYVSSPSSCFASKQ